MKRLKPKKVRFIIRFLRGPAASKIADEGRVCSPAAVVGRSVTAALHFARVGRCNCENPVSIE